LLDAIHLWETARLSGAFSEEQKGRLKDPKNEFHLESRKGAWLLYQFETPGRFEYVKKEKQPGEPLYDQWEFTLSSFEQPFRFQLDVMDTTGSISHMKLILDNYFEIHIPMDLLAGETVIADGSAILRIYDRTGKFKAIYELPSALPLINTGAHTMRFSCDFIGGETNRVGIAVKSLGNPDIIPVIPK
jgi:hypothetical protein